MWVRTPSDMIVNLDRASVVGVTAKDIDANQFVVIVHVPPLPPIVLLEGTRALCQARLEELYRHLELPTK